MTQHPTGDLRVQLADQAGHSARLQQVAMAAGTTRTLARTWQRDKNASGSSRTRATYRAVAPNAASGAASRQPSERNKQP